MSYNKYIEFLKQNGIQRTDYTDREVALNKADVLKALELLKDTKMCVLGGDIYELEKDGYLRPTYDNWYFEKNIDSEEECVKKSIEKAYQYISNYKESEDQSIRYILVLDQKDK